MCALFLIWTLQLSASSSLWESNPSWLTIHPLTPAHTADALGSRGTQCCSDHRGPACGKLKPSLPLGRQHRSNSRMSTRSGRFIPKQSIPHHSQLQVLRISFITFSVTPLSVPSSNTLHPQLVPKAPPEKAKEGSTSSHPLSQHSLLVTSQGGQQNLLMAEKSLCTMLIHSMTQRLGQNKDFFPNC